jgi:glutaminyl-tRNA synthetase
MNEEKTGEEKSLNFLEEIIEADLKSGKHKTIITRFPPEPNGYLHIGHASSICLNFGLALRYGGTTNLRFDDTNPATEEAEFVESIRRDVQWLGFNWARELYASDYFPELYAFAEKLIEMGLAYVDDSTSEEIAIQKGSPTQPGVRNACALRGREENLRLFREMKDGKYPDGAMVLRARIDMASPNMLMRDPVLYRIKHVPHHRTGTRWCIYPMYDFAHGQSDSLEGITHSICTMEFVPHRELYDWFIEKLGIFPSRQYEFARRNLTYTVMSKRKLLQLVNEGHTAGWDDPRMPTLSGMRRRGYPPEAIRDFVSRIGVGKRENIVDVGLLEFCVREQLNKTALRRMVVFDPLPLVITNYPEGQSEVVQSENNPEQPETGTRSLPFSRNLLIEREDFMENPPKKYFRLAPGQMVRLKSAYIIECTSVEKNEDGSIREVHCRYLPESKSGEDRTGLKVQGTLHWVEAGSSVPCRIREYDRLFLAEDPSSEEGDFKSYLNPASLTETRHARAEPILAEARPGQSFQFLRKGYFCPDTGSTPGEFVFNRTVTLKDTWAREQKKT